jgi:hypothetical protein
VRFGKRRLRSRSPASATARREQGVIERPPWSGQGRGGISVP